MNPSISDQIKELAKKYAEMLKKQIDARMDEMKMDDRSHYLIYRTPGITDRDGTLIDLYQNKGRFLYKYAGSFLETAMMLCFQTRYQDARKIRIPNIFGSVLKILKLIASLVTKHTKLNGVTQLRMGIILPKNILV